MKELTQSKETETAISLVVKESQINGQGSFTTTRIEAGQTIKLLTGKVASGLEIYQLQQVGDMKEDDEIQLDEDLFLIPEENSFKYINHSCNPNTGIKGERELFALRVIEQGEEIAFDYSTTVGVDDEPSWPSNFTNSAWLMQCNCGFENCRKRIGNISTIPKEILRKYLQLGALSDFIKGQVEQYHLL